MATVETKCCDVFPQRTSPRNKIVKVEVNLLYGGELTHFPPIDASPQAIKRLVKFIEKGLRPPKGKTDGDK